MVATPSSGDLLAELAALAFRTAPETCGGAGCATYHRIRPTVRLLGLARSLETDRAAIADAVHRAALRSPAPRILIAGAADSGLLAAVAAALPDATAAAITLVDRCRTPLALNRIYAEREGIALTTVHGGVADVVQPPFDLVCAHGLFGFLTGAERDAAARAWFRLLRPGGAVFTANRIRPGGGGAAFKTVEAEQFARRIADAAAQHALPVGVPLDAFPEAVADFTAHYVRHPVRSHEELEAPFAAAGFRLERLEAVASGAGGDAPFGPRASDGGRMRLTAVRPG